MFLLLIPDYDSVMEISRNEEVVLKFLGSARDSEFIQESGLTPPGLSRPEVSSAVSWLESKSLVDIRKESREGVFISDEGREYLKNGLPEAIIFNAIRESGRITVKDCMAKLGQDGAKIALAQLSKLGLKPRNGEITYNENQKIQAELKRRMDALESLSRGEEIPDDIIEHFRKRENVINVRSRTIRYVRINSNGKEYLKSHRDEEKIDSLTPEMITSGSWKGRRFREYDLNSPVERISSASKHPMTYLIDRVRQIFLSMGFMEMKGRYVEYSGWNMDALFIPQDHPARDMQDTFYLKSTRNFEFEHPEIIEVLRGVHEKGFMKYPGWQYKWSEEKARELLLRTHTTVSTIRYLYENQTAPLALFSVEKVFRHESVDWKHLAELHQIEGAVRSEEANISTLKGLMRVFYEQLGFKEIKFMPSYYPYTEPSMDAVVKIGGKEVELGGSGVFRPEVTEPLGIKEPVIAWGLGLERLAMIYYNLMDIREIYNSDFEWLKSFKINP